MARATRHSNRLPLDTALKACTFANGKLSKASRIFAMSRTPKLKHPLPALSRRRSLGLVTGSALGLGPLILPGTALARHRRRRRNHRHCPSLRSMDANLALEWFELILELIKGTPGYTPPVASRSLAYISCALYEAVHQDMPGFSSLTRVLDGFPTMRRPRGARLHYGIIANAALAEAASLFFPTTTDALWQSIQTLRDRYNQRFRAQAGSGFSDSVTHGEIIARQIFVYSRSDGADASYDNNFPSSYTPPTGFGLWEPTDAQGALQPYWGENRAFALTRNNMFDPGPHTPPFSDRSGSAFYELAREVRDAVVNATPQEVAIAKFWSDDPVLTATPPGHSFSIATQALRAQGRKLDKAIEVYVKLGIAQADAFISCWQSKYHYKVIRPITYIRRYFPGDAGWTPILPTPPFPEYTSGHSVQSGAMAEVLTRLLGENYAFVDRTHASRGLGTRSFASFSAAADEAAVSRLYGGVHYTPAIDLGVAQGRKVGRLVNALPFKRR